MGLGSNNAADEAAVRKGDLPVLLFVVLLLIAPRVLVVHAHEGLLLVEDQIVLEVFHVPIQLFDLTCQDDVRARILIVDCLEVGDPLVKVSERYIMVGALVLEHLSLKVFDSLFLILNRGSVCFADLQKAFILLNELLHPCVEQVLS